MEKKQSLRGCVIQLEVGNTLTVPIERYDYLASLIYRVGRALKRRYTASNNGDTITVTRIS